MAGHQAVLARRVTERGPLQQACLRGWRKGADGSRPLHQLPHHGRVVAIGLACACGVVMARRGSHRENFTTRESPAWAALLETNVPRFTRQAGSRIAILKTCVS